MPKLTTTVTATVAGLGLIGVHRAFVSLPEALTHRDRPLQERVVFFEAPHRANRAAHLEQLLASAWCVDTTDWTERGYIYGISCCFDRLNGTDYSCAPAELGDLRLFDTGSGGPSGVGPDRVHYARAADVDLFVSPLRAERLRASLSCIERLYAAHAAARASCPPEPLKALAKRVANLNPDSPTIGAGMLGSLVADARRALALPTEQVA